MASKFPLLTDLHPNDQAKIAAINAKPSGARTADETAFLNARTQYTAQNEIILQDANGLIVMASGNGVPASGWTGFRKGALYINKNASDYGLYTNNGDQTSTTWKFITAS